ncbi:MAG: carbohydrate binding family 9 domain-containing protein [Gemmatimonadetes bacterium]|nr:carbohydrate binding family 9 domain-containing protein [Gemmatimonadota bacterium]
MRLRSIPALVLLASASPVGARRATAQPSPKIASATRTSRAPRIDGRLSEAEWQRAEVISDLTQQRPLPGGAPTERTLVYLLYDDEAVYVGARLLRRDPRAIVRNLSRRDGGGSAERFTITLDPQRDRRTGVGFGVTAAGVRSDFRHTQDDDMRGRESQFDPVWTASAQVDSAGWTAEMRIPLSQLRFPAAARQQWGVQFDRWLPDKNEELQWVMIPPTETGYISRFGTLVGIDSVRNVRPVEVLPYLAGDATRRATTGVVRNPLNRPLAGRVGGDIKFGLGSNLTVDATINPDFGQVEADPAEVNLSAFETFFDERRPFFVEGGEMLRGSGAQYFYARRIGAPPHAGASGDFVDIPRASTILGAAKITGRLPSRLSVGGLAAVTAQEVARTYHIDSAFTGRVRVEPRTAYSVGRLQQEIGQQASTVALSWSTTNRQFGGDSQLAALLPRDAYYAGVDWRLRFQQGKYAISGFAAGTRVDGDTAAIRRLQTASTRFFQRPDMTHAPLDPLRTSLSGYSLMLRADKDAGRRILWGAELKAESPGFELNDLGRMQSTDDIEYNADLQVRETRPGRWFQSWQLGFETRGARTYGGVHQGNSWTQNTRFTLKNFWNINLRSSIDLATLDDALTRGGPLMGRPREFKQELRLNNAFGAPTFWRVNAGYGVDEFDTYRVNAGGQVTLRPSSRVSLSVEPTWQQGTDPRQYVTRVAGGTRTYGNRYVFGVIDRSTLSTKLRLNYTFSPNLTIEGYAEPFAATGHYTDMGELVAPRSRALRMYGTDGTTVSIDSAGTRTITDGAGQFTLSNRDFHVLSFRSNVVMRWEWTPGSTLFVVWQQNRRTSDAYRQALSPRELFQTTRAAGDNLVSVKVSYWLPVLFGGQRYGSASRTTGE